MSKHERPPPKFGAGHMQAMGRQGLSELRSALYPDSNVAQRAEYGIYGTLPPGEVSEQRYGDHRDMDHTDPTSFLRERLEKARAREVHERGRETPEPERS